MPMITLYGMGSPNVVKVVIALEELGLAYDFVHLDVMRGDQFGEDFGRLTPNRKVPVIVDDEGPAQRDGGLFTLWESGAILIYLAERSGSFLPADPAARYVTLQWLMFQMASIGPMSGQLSHFRYYAPEPEHAYARDRYATEVKRIYDVVETRLQQTAYLAGEDYSIADMAAWPWLKGAKARGVDLGTLPAVKRWVDEIAARPAVSQAQAVLDAQDNTETLRIMKEGGDPLDRYLGRGKWSRPELA
jgi:GST-like protein